MANGWFIDKNKPPTINLENVKINCDKSEGSLIKILVLGTKDRAFALPLRVLRD
jgi:hypothetical protein